MQQAYKIINDADHAELVKIASDWGWNNPPSEILLVAEQARKSQNMKSADLLVSLGIISRQQRDQILAFKPDNVPTIAWFAKQDNLSIPMERILALMNGYAFYEHLSQLSIHPGMQIKGVIKNAEALDAAIMLIEETVPVLVFSTFASLLQFRSLGRAERMRSAILLNLNKPDMEPQLAVGTRDEISAILKSVRSEDVAGSLESANVWNAETAENKNKPENREITRILDHALKLGGVTDIYFKPSRSGEFQIQFRRDGLMISPNAVSDRMNAELATKTINILQAKSGANPTNTIQRIPTDGQITYRSAVGDAFLRLSFIPLNHPGELRNLTSVEIRLLARSESSVSLSELKLNADVITQIHFAMKMSRGLVLVTGPTGEGKSTTVAGCIGEHVKIFGDTHKRLAVEDPVECFSYGITQINVPPINTVKHGEEDRRFNNILRAVKRHDPDMINIGEVRDHETANLCVDSASTGHLVLSTLHAPDSIMGFYVLAMAVSPDKRFQLVESMSMVISQRLIRVLCTECRKVTKINDDEAKLFSFYLKNLGEEAEVPSTLAHANPNGCSECGHAGYKGRLPINETLPFARNVKDAAHGMLSGVNSANYRKVMADARTVTLLQSSLELLRNHQIELDEFLV